ncbi:MAG: hypothetical protein WKF40_00320 [Thermoleophilaceae bacterium]
MKSSKNRATRHLVVSGFVLAAFASSQAAGGSTQTAEGARKAPTVKQMVVFNSGRAKLRTVKAAGLKVKVGSRRRSVGHRHPAGRPGALAAGPHRAAQLRGQLYVSSIASDRARGLSGWLYKVGNKLASAGAADPSGPFGSGRLRTGQRVTWYYGSLEGQSGPRTLTLKVTAGSAPGTATARVRSYDDEGRGRAEAGVSVKASGGTPATTSADGSAVVAATAGRRAFTAAKSGSIRSFPVRATVR